jgi:hypothetical protein
MGHRELHLQLRFIECNMKSFLQTVYHKEYFLSGTRRCSHPSSSGSSCPTGPCNIWAGGLDLSALHARSGARHYRCAELPRSGRYAHRSADGWAGSAASSQGGSGKGQAGRGCDLCWNQVGDAFLYQKFIFVYRTFLSLYYFCDFGLKKLIR